jgi:hypothetical protein
MYYGIVARIVEMVGVLGGVYYHRAVESIEDKKKIIQ